MTEPVIAVIDQDPEFLTIINEALAQSGYIAILSQGDAQTKSLIERERPSLIIIDETMCGSDRDSEFLHSVIAGAEANNIPMLMTTSDGGELAPAQARFACRFQSLNKPVDADELRSILHGVIGPMRPWP